MQTTPSTLSVQQELRDYSLVEHSLWSQLSQSCFEGLKGKAHPNCLNGIRALGLTSELVPSISAIGQRLSHHGWSAIPVRGFIAPRKFFSFLRRRILPIAVEMRRPEFLAFSPEPDIFHEAFGHACLLVDPLFASYLQKFGEIASKAFQYPEDRNYYQTVSNLANEKSILPNLPATFRFPQGRQTQLSEASVLARLGWWTFECGLIETSEHIGKPLAYGATILSSMSELDNTGRSTRLLPLTEECIQYEFDPTELQSQYFVAPNFSYLSQLLNSFASKMAFYRGGTMGLQTAAKSRERAKVILSSGRILEGTISNFTAKTGQVTEIVFDESYKGAGSKTHQAQDIREHRHQVRHDESIVSVYPAESDEVTSWN